LKNTGCIKPDVEYVIESANALSSAIECIALGSVLEGEKYDYFYDYGLSLYTVYEINGDEKILLESISSYHRALSYISFENSPYEYANTQYCLGNALYYQGQSTNDIDVYNHALKAFEETTRSYPDMNDRVFLRRCMLR